MVARDYKNGKLLYHFTSLRNLESIFREGLLPRSQRKPIVDVANPEILDGREVHRLDTMVPFHFFADNPFDGRVKKDHPLESFVYIAVQRVHASQSGWQISPKHPLNGEFKLLGYEEGIATIDWDTMNKRDYLTQNGKSVCMAECLSPDPVASKFFQQIYVKTENDEQTVNAILRDVGIRCWVNVNERMFPR